MHLLIATGMVSLVDISQLESCRVWSKCFLIHPGFSNEVLHSCSAE